MFELDLDYEEPPAERNARRRVEPRGAASEPTAEPASPSLGSAGQVAEAGSASKLPVATPTIPDPLGGWLGAEDRNR